MCSPTLKNRVRWKKELYGVLENRAKKVIMKTQLINSTKFINTYIFELRKKKIGNTKKFQSITMKNSNSNKKMKSLFSNYSSLLDNRRASLWPTGQKLLSSLEMSNTSNVFESNEDFCLLLSSCVVEFLIIR